MNTKKIYKDVTKQLNKSQAVLLVVEEISELISEISLIISSNYDYDDLCEEVADVRIMTNLIKKTFGISDEMISKYQKDLKPDFKKNYKTHTTKENIKSCIVSLTDFQKVICKKVRGRHNKKDIAMAIANVELSINYLAKQGFIKPKDCDEWEKKKLKRMQKRIKKNQIM